MRIPFFVDKTGLTPVFFYVQQNKIHRKDDMYANHKNSIQKVRQRR